jgi:hypothetical protein
MDVLIKIIVKSPGYKGRRIMTPINLNSADCIIQFT